MLVIDPHALVDPNANIASDVEIGPFSIIGANVSIGTGTTVGSHSVIEGVTDIGERNSIHNHTVIGAPPQDLKYKGEVTKLQIGNENIIREFSTIHRGTPEGGGITRIGNKCMIMAYAHIAHDCQIGNEVILANAVNMAGHVSIDDFAVVGGLCAIHQFVRIGRYAFIGGATPVAQDVLPFALIAGTRGELKGINAVGLKRRGFNSERRKQLKRIVRYLINSKMNVSQVLAYIKSEAPDNNVDIKELIDFISSSERGICL